MDEKTKRALGLVVVFGGVLTFALLGYSFFTSSMGARELPPAIMGGPGMRGHNASEFLTPADPLVVHWADRLDGDVNSLWDFVVTLGYNADETDYWQFPNETLTRRVGDSEDCAFLLASLLLRKGHAARVVFGYVAQHGDSDKIGYSGVHGHHAWTQVFDVTAGAGAWVDLETTRTSQTNFTWLWDAEVRREYVVTETQTITL